MGDNDRSRPDPCQSGRLTLWTDDNPLDRLQQFLGGLIEGRRQNDMHCLELRLDYTQDIAARIVNVFEVCLSKEIQWNTLRVYFEVDNQNRFLHFILSEARRLRQFKEVDLVGSLWRRECLTNATAMELRAMMSSKQGIERLSLGHACRCSPVFLLICRKVCARTEF
jgi:hypothetical protein